MHPPHSTLVVLPPLLLLSCCGTRTCEAPVVEEAAPVVVDMAELAAQLEPGDGPFLWEWTYRSGDGAKIERHAFVEIIKAPPAPVLSNLRAEVREESMDASESVSAGQESARCE